MLFAAAILVYSLDQLTKLFMVSVLPPGGSIPLIGNIVRLTLVYNTGAAFGAFRGHPRLFLLIALFSFFFICLFLRLKHKDLRFPEKLALTFVLSGTAGNLTDRLRVGRVVDFIDLRVWPVFNFADTFITAGMVILAVSILLKTSHAGHRA